MGANQSFETEFSDVTGSAATAGAKQGRHDGTVHHYKRKKAKPAAPHRPSVTAVTHNAVSLTWLPPRHALHAIIAYTVEACRPRHSRQWLTLTKNCQGTRFQARELDSDTEYLFRVRAENIFGTGKPSARSETVTTKIFEMSSDLSCYITPSSPVPTSSTSPSPADRGFPKSFSYDGAAILIDAADGAGNVVYPSNAMVKSPSLPVNNNYSSSSSLPFGGASSSSHSSNLSLSQNPFGSVRRRHSFNVRLEGRVCNMLNNSDRFLSTSSITSSTSTIVTSTNGIEPCSNLSASHGRSGRTRTGSILRHNAHRSSLQPSRKSTIPILLPGTGSSSLNRLRESRSSLKSTSSTGSTDTLGNPQTQQPISRHYKLLTMNRNRRNGESRNSFGSTVSDSTTYYSSSSTSSSNSKDDNNRYNRSTNQQQGSRLSLQSALSDVTMSVHSQSSDDQSSRPASFSDNGESVDLGIVVNGVSQNTSLTTSCESNREHFDNDSGVGVTVSVRDDETCLDEKNNNNDNGNNDYDDDDDYDISKLKRDLKNLDFTEEKLKFHDLKERLKILSEEDNTTTVAVENCNNNNNNCNYVSIMSPKEYYQTLDNPWEKGTGSVNSVSENIMAAPFTDDIKMALNARNNNSNSDDVISRMSTAWDWRRAAVANGGPEVGQEKDDFRTLRSVLQSNHMIVKQSRSMPEVVGVVLGEGGETTTLTRGKLTTIADEDEEEEAVRVTTL